MAQAQCLSWAKHAHLLPELPTSDEVESAWLEALTHPPSPAHRILIASSGPQLVGFAAYGPGSEVSSGEIFDLVIAPDFERSGHGSRLLASLVSDLQAQGQTLVTTWVAQADTARQRFLAAAGLRTDGARRLLGAANGQELWQSQWSATLPER